MAATEVVLQGRPVLAKDLQTLHVYNVATSTETFSGVFTGRLAPATVIFNCYRDGVLVVTKYVSDKSLFRDPSVEVTEDIVFDPDDPVDALEIEDEEGGTDD